jgi:DNA-binding NarL/FixJ family response regulator
VTHTVVVVDDEPGLRRLLRLLLDRDGGFTVLAEAGDGIAALEAVRAHDPDLLLLDLGLPGLDGLEVLEQLREQRRPATVVLTGFADQTTHDQASALGAAACLVKGTDFDRVVATLHEVATAGG